MTKKKTAADFKEELMLCLKVAEQGTDPARFLRRIVQLHKQGYDQKTLSAYSLGYGEGKCGAFDIQT